MWVSRGTEEEVRHQDPCRPRPLPSVGPSWDADSSPDAAGPERPHDPPEPCSHRAAHLPTDRKKDLSKMKSLLNILTDPNTRCPLKTLQKCEIALEKLKNDMAVVSNKQQYLCQPLLDAVMANIRSPVFNHSLYRTFAPAMGAIHGPAITAPPGGRKRKVEEEERLRVPNVLQGEVARLDLKFLVNLDPGACCSNGTVHLVCKLGETTRDHKRPLETTRDYERPLETTRDH
ncbi:Mediator of RNA polymerase II transcription subunit 15 [Liparis tanakae]|uniref:Mediator of RNA polymerase II transcription subunit 15 n=1 Tax=Liparis tanakae TaxID=230148 RepID=A0A4Z2IQF5_9TELE|nr:Mediator of RNA polymerase II transcription subunit 15 [Liparis tanakae]